MTYFDTQDQALDHLESRGVGQMDAAQVAAELRTIVDSIRRLPPTVITAFLSGGPTWVAHECSLWNLGEVVRQVLKAKRKWDPTPILEVVDEVVRDKGLGKGRQTFVRIFERCRAVDYRQTLMAAVSDEDICGHAMKALRVGGVPGASELARKLLKAPKPGWIRAEARKYLSKFP